MNIVKLIALSFFFAGPSLAQDLPASLDAGGRTLALASQATRSELFGSVELYKVGVYAPLGSSTLQQLRSTRTPKALLVDVLYDGSLPDSIPSGWTSELRPALARAQQQKLSEAYANLGPQDEIRIVYVPGSGTRLNVSGRTVLNTEGHGLMSAFLDIWMGQTPVSEELKQSLVGEL